MKVKLIKNHAVHVRTLKKGSVLHVTNELGNSLIEKKVAKEFKGVSLDEKLMEGVIKEAQE